MATLSQDLLNLCAVALDAPLTKLEQEAVEALALNVANGPPELEMDNLRQLKVRLLVASKVNKIKEERANGNG